MFFKRCVFLCMATTLSANMCGPYGKKAKPVVQICIVAVSVSHMNTNVLCEDALYMLCQLVVTCKNMSQICWNLQSYKIFKIISQSLMSYALY